MELMLLQGAPGSGKTAIGEKFIEGGQPDGVSLLSIGALKRSILAGNTLSVWADRLRQTAHPDRKTGAAPSDAMAGIMTEYLQRHENTLTILDGYPRYADRLPSFRRAVQELGADVLALCVVEAPDEVLIRRMQERPVRPNQVMKDPAERLADHVQNVVPVLEELAQHYPYYNLDGTLPLETNATELFAVYERHTGSL